MRESSASATNQDQNHIFFLGFHFSWAVEAVQPETGSSRNVHSP